MRNHFRSQLNIFLLPSATLVAGLRIFSEFAAPLLAISELKVFDFKCSMKEEIYVVSSNHHVVYTKVKTPLKAPSTNRHFLCFFSFFSGFFVDTFCHIALCAFLSLRGGYLSYG